MKLAQRKKLIYVRNTDSSWTRRDFEILKNHFDVDDHYIKSVPNILGCLNPFYILKSDIIVCWFASLRFFPLIFFAWLLRRKVVIIAGGFDVVKLPSIGYGGGMDPWYIAPFRKFMFKAASKVISISKSNQREAWENMNVSRGKSSLVYHGFESKDSELVPFESRKKQIVTVGAVNNDNYLRKGHKYFLELAQRMPDWNFVLIGKTAGDIHFHDQFQSCSNLQVMGYVDEPKLDELFNESKFYIQLSEHEGFGCSIVEAALMGCYPVVFKRFSMPEVVEDCGHIASSNTVDEVEKILESLAGQSFDVEVIRKHYQEKFSFHAREKGLIRAVEGGNG